MENRSRDTIASRAAILRNGDTGLVEKFSSTNSIAGRAAIMANNNSRAPKQAMKKPNQLPGQSNMKNYDRPMTVGSVLGIPNSGNIGARQMELNLKVSPPPSNSPVQRKLEVQSSSPSFSIEDTGVISRERLQEAIIWTEILGKPVCKRRKRHHN